MRKIIFLVALVTMLLIVNTGSTLMVNVNNDGNWFIEIVDSSGDVGGGTSLAFDSKNNPHISYHGKTNEDLKYAVKKEYGWEIETVDFEDEIIDTCLAIDTNDQPHICYRDWFHKYLKYAVKIGGEWIVEPLEFTKHTFNGPSLVLDSQDSPHICYSDGSTSIIYVYKTEYEWKTEIVDSEDIYVADAAPSIALDSNDQPHICYYDQPTQTLKYAEKSGYEWLIEVVDSPSHVGGTVTSKFSLALDNNDCPHICYYDGGDNEDLKYAVKTVYGWETETVDSTYNSGSNPAIAIDSNNQPHIGYYSSDGSSGDLKYAVKKEYGWETETVDEYHVAVQCSIKLDSYDTPHISYYNRVNNNLLYAYIKGEDSPSAPLINGPSTGSSEEEYEYTFVSTDPEGDDVYYWIDWGDGTTIEWEGPYISGEKATFTEPWDAEGTYLIEAKAKDIYGFESEWSKLKVSMPRSKVIITPIQRFLDIYPRLSLFFHHILGDSFLKTLSFP